MVSPSHFGARVKPSAGPHAIEAMALAVEWARPLDSAAIGAATTAFRNDAMLLAFLPTERKFPAFEIRIEGQAASVEPNNIEVVDFIQFREDGQLAWSLSLRPEFFSCNCAVYSRWADIKPRTLSLLAPIVGAALSVGAQIQAVGLQYSDAFRWEKNDDAALREVLRSNSGLIPPIAMEHPSLWHAHNGWFSVGEHGHRILNTVNVDLADEAKARVLKLNGQHRVQAVAFADGSPLPIEVSKLEAIADLLHIANKKAVQEVLSDACLQLINMTKVED